MSDITKLVAQITAAKRTYYQGTKELVLSDAAYDALEDQLRALDPLHPELLKVGAAPAGKGWLKVKHGIPMSSLNKAQVLADMTAWFAAVGNPLVAVMDKLDGISCAMHYFDRKLVQALTRGDGTIGEDITKNVMLMKGAVKVLPPTMPDGTPTPKDVHVRSEVVVTHNDFATHFKGESNTRNTASGTAKRQSDNSKCAFLTVICYQLLPGGRPMASKSAELKALATMGFQVPRWGEYKGLAAVEALYQDYIKTIRKGLGYDIDGLVIEVDDANARAMLGERNKRPHGAIAYKFPHESKPTILKNIRWQVGNSGRVTPVAEFEIVNLAGANVRQASLHNISNIEGLWGKSIVPVPGDTILVSRRNDVIPYVEEVLNKFGTGTGLCTPTQCPSCKGALERDGEYLVCRSEECPAQATGAIRRWVKKLGVLHVGETLIDAMVEAFPFTLTEEVFASQFGTLRPLTKCVDKKYSTLPTFESLPPNDQERIRNAPMDIADLYNLDLDEVASLELSGRRVGGSADKALRNLEAKKTLPLHVLIGSLGIPLIGRSMAKVVVDAGYTTLNLLFKAKVHVPIVTRGKTLPAVASIPGMGDTKALAFVTGFAAKAGLIVKLRATQDLGGADITIQDISGPLLGMTFCLTGTREPALLDAIEKAGGTMKGSVSKKLSYLIALDPDSTSGKAKKAKQYGVKVIGLDEAYKLAGV